MFKTIFNQLKTVYEGIVNRAYAGFEDDFKFVQEEEEEDDEAPEGEDELFKSDGGVPAK